MQKMARSVSPNLGLAKAFEKKIRKLKSDAVDEMIADVLKDLIENGFLRIVPKSELAQDASLTNPALKKERDKLNRILRRISKDIAQKDLAALHVQSFIDKNLAKWFGNVDADSRKVAEWFVRNQVVQTSLAQKRSLESAGVASEAFKQLWNVPVVKGQYMSRECALAMPAYVEEITSLVTNLATEELGKLQNVFVDSISQGQDTQELKDVLSTFKNFDKNRVRTVSIDQTNKISFAIQRENSKSLGIRKGKWVHVPGTYSSRETHRCPHTQRTKKGFKGLNGAIFDLDTGIYDESVGRYVWPASEINCRCEYRQVLPDYLKEFQK